MANQLQLRRDTAATWAAVNPVMAQGELGIDLTNKTFKIGDGVTAWNALPYAAIGDMTQAQYDTNEDGVLNVGAIPTGISAANIGAGTVSNTEFGYLDGVTSAIQTQIDGKQASLGFTAENVANKDTDGTLAGNSDTKYPTQKAVKTYADTKQSSLGFTPENVANKDTDGTLAANSDTKYASQKATKTYADTKVSAITLNTPNTVYATPVTFSVTTGSASGTLSLNTQNKNKVFAGPASGSDATPAFRVLDPADMPAIQYNRQTSSYTLVLTDYYKVVEMNVGTANNLTVPLNSSVAFPIGTQILIAQYGEGQTTIVATGGVTLRSDTAKLKISAQYCGAALLKVATDEWYVFGALTA